MNRFTTPVMFAFEKNVVLVFGKISFQSNGIPVLDTNNSKGICSFAPNSPTFTGSTASGSSTITSVSSFNDVFTGMTLSGTGIAAGATIGTITAATGSIVMSAPAASAQASTTLAASGGQYLVQFGQQAATRLDTYNKMLGYDYVFDVSTGSASGGFLTTQIAPACQTSFIVTNNTSIRTIPGTLTSGSTDASLTLQFGNGNGTSFVASNPSNGEILRMAIQFGNSTAP